MYFVIFRQFNLKILHCHNFDVNISVENKTIRGVLFDSFVYSVFFDFVIKRILKVRKYNAEYLIVDIPTYFRYDTNLYWKYNRHECDTSFIILSHRLLVLRLHKLSRINMIFTFVNKYIQEIHIDF